MLGAVLGQPQPDREQHQRDRAEGQVDVERPAPVQMIGDVPAGQRPGHHRHGHHAGHVALVPAALAGRYEVADDRHGADEQPARAQPLHRAEPDELGHRVGGSGQGRAGQKDHDRGKEHTLAPVQVADLAPERGGDRRAEDIGGDHPRQVGQAVQVADDARHRGTDDHVVQHREQDRE